MTHGLPDLPPVPELDLESLEPEDAREMVAEAFHTFGEPAARQLALHLCVSLEACGEAIERLRGRLQ